MTDQLTDQPTNQPFYLVYVSTATLLFTRDDLDRLLRRCRAHNTELGVTGALLYRDGTFMQVLEGDEATVRSLFLTISGDPRHYDVTYITDGATTHRQFDQWSMAFRDLDLGTSEFAEDYNSFFTEQYETPGPDRHAVARRLLSRFRATLV